MLFSANSSLSKWTLASVTSLVNARVAYRAAHMYMCSAVNLQEITSLYTVIRPCADGFIKITINGRLLMFGTFSGFYSLFYLFWAAGRSNQMITNCAGRFGWNRVTTYLRIDTCRAIVQWNDDATFTCNSTRCKRVRQ